ncbi:putative reticulocyte-binding protein 2 like protein a [Rhexocercosporidium sp. MPI-PUGE-AT-0058]|nr:putative reticulocyte-binding protein 2 like protein a [Rhexocercosporidium sp. MPI-PUGE-AT-0058]
MTSFNNFSCGSSKLWDPIASLGIINPDPGYQRITCVGYAPSQGRRCRMAINQHNRQTITETLNEMSYLHPSDPEVVSRLKSIAGTALCIRFHQAQASNILSQWRSKLPKVHRIDSDKNPRSSRTSRSQARSYTSEDLQEQLRKLRELMDQLEENLNAQKSDSSSGDESEEDFVPRDYQTGNEKNRFERERLEKERKAQEARKRRDTEQTRQRAQSKARKDAQDMREKEKKEQENREREQKRAEEAAREREQKKEKERKEKERKEQEAKKARDAENAASNERMRQRARERAENAAREKREKEEREQAEWNQAWTRYQDQWLIFKISSSTDRALRDAIPWPVRTGSFSDVNASTVKAFLENALPKDTVRVKLLRKECQKWHPDVTGRWSRAGELTDVERMMIEMICRVVTDQLNSYSGKSSEFL